MSQIIGILNLTADSFSDGGRFPDPQAAIEHALHLAADGAAIIDVGAESSHPDGLDVSVENEISRLTPVVTRLMADGLRVSVDTWKPPVIREMLRLGVQYINDITAMRDSESIAGLRASAAKVIIMHSRAPLARAKRDSQSPPPNSISTTTAATAAVSVAEILSFFQERIAALETAGIERSRIVVDPGMGFFLSSDPAPSLAVLRELPRFRALGQPVCVCVSRKSFIGSVLGRSVAERGSGTLASELYAFRQGADFIRTHDVRALADGIKMLQAIDGA